MRRIDVPVGTEGQVIRVELRDDLVHLSRPGRWEQVLTREEAWRFAEAIDEVATAGDDPSPLERDP